MKAVIMAGGRGTRLNPLTCNLPKPLVPLLGRPCMEYIVELLKRHGVREIGVTVHHMPKAIQAHFGDGSRFGVRLSYFEEATPLGTAGSVKNMEAFLNEEDFLVVSGDALTDFDLDKAIEYHYRKGSWATLVASRVDDPTQYGVILADDEGRINRFVEKPRWSEVFSNLANTGIYVLKRRVLSYFEQGEIYDFGKNLFPLLLKEHRPMFAYDAAGYWSDIGSLEMYRRAQFDMLDEKVQVRITGSQIAPGVWAGENVSISDSAEIVGPTFIGSESRIEDGTRLGRHSVIGAGCILLKGAATQDSVVWDGCHLDSGCRVTGACIGRNVVISRGSVVHDGSVVGDGCILGWQTVVEPGLKLFPDKVILNKAMAGASLTGSQLLYAMGAN